MALLLPMQRVSDVYKKLEQELQDPALPAAAAPDLVLYMLQLQSEGLAVAAGQDPLALFLAARQKQFSTAVEQAVLEYQQGMGSLRGQMAAATAKDGKQQVRVGYHYENCVHVQLVVFNLCFL